MEEPLLRLLTAFISILMAQVAGTGSNLISKNVDATSVVSAVRLDSLDFFARVVVGDYLVILVVVNVRFEHLRTRATQPHPTNGAGAVAFVPQTWCGRAQRHAHRCEYS